MTSKLKRKSNRKKRWQLNVFVCYYGQENAKSYRFNILELLKHLASIYRLDYSITVDHQTSSDTDSSGQSDDTCIYDLIYFRSNENSRLEKKYFRETIDCTFRKVPSAFFEGVDIWTQLYKDLKNFPFPTDFYRPLNYPWIEHHTDSQKKLLIYADAYLTVIEEEQDYTLN
ncbi:MAG: hypothetical protein R2757_20080 [Draconibacterium sp.]